MLTFEEIRAEQVQELELFLAQAYQTYQLSGSNLANNTRAGYDAESLTITYPEYGFFVNSGRRPGAKQPPSNVILEWLLRNNIRPRQPNQSLNGLAYVIARSIGLRGIAPRPWLDLTVEIFENWFFSEGVQRYQQYIDDRLNTLSDGN